MLSAFSGMPFTHGNVSIVPGVKEAVKAGDVSSLNPVELDTGKVKFTWPNDVRVVPHDVFNKRAIVVPDGFIPPGHNNGNVFVIEMDDSELTKTS